MKPSVNAFDDLCDAVGRTPKTVRQWIRDGKLPGRFVSERTCFVPRGEFEAFCRGEWQPKGTAEQPEPTPMVKSRKVA